MKHKVISFISALAALTLQMNTSHAEPTVKQQLIANYEAISKDFKVKKFNAMGSYLAPNFVTILPGGKTVKKSDVMNGMKSERETISHVTWKRTITKLTVEKGIAKVEVTGDMKGEVKGPQGKLEKVELKAVSNDVWKKMNGRWLITTAYYKSSTMIVNGKVMKGMR